MKRGATIELDGRVYQVMEFHLHQDGPRLRTDAHEAARRARGDTIERSQAGEKWPRVRVDRVAMQFSYAEDNIMHFMNTETYDQVPLTTDQGEAKDYSPRTRPVMRSCPGDEPIGIELPSSVVMTVTRVRAGSQR